MRITLLCPCSTAPILALRAAVLLLLTLLIKAELRITVFSALGFALLLQTLLLLAAMGAVGLVVVAVAAALADFALQQRRSQPA